MLIKRRVLSRLFGRLGFLAPMTLLVANGAPIQQAPVNLEGTVEFIQPNTCGEMNLQVSSGTNLTFISVEHADGRSPLRFSRIRATGIWSHVPGAKNHPVALRLIVPDIDHIQLLTGSLAPLATNVSQLNQLGTDGRVTRCVAFLRGMVLGAGTDGRDLAFQDDSGVAILDTESPHQTVHAGQRIILTGNAEVQGTHIRFCNPPLINNDGLHGMTEQSASIFLAEGRHAIHLSWFNSAEPHGLEVYYQGPNLPRQKIPDAALFRPETNFAGATQWVQGLDYKCCEGDWFSVPDFDWLIPVKEGVVANFDTRVIPRNRHVGLEFNGYLNVPRDGIYTFSTLSDDGSLLFIGGRPPSLKVIGSGALPQPRIIAAGQVLQRDQAAQWAQVEGTVTFASRQEGALDLVLNSDTGRMMVKVLDDAGAVPQMFLHSLIRITGICRGAYSTDGQIVAGTLEAPGLRQIEWRNLAPEEWSAHAVVPIRDISPLAMAAKTIIHIRGEFVSSLPNGALLVKDATGQIPVEALQPPPAVKGSPVEVLGYRSGVGSNTVLRCACYRDISDGMGGNEKHLPVLTTVEQIKRLTHAEWQQGYPVRIRGVVTTVLDSGFFIQDSTAAIYARWQPPLNQRPLVGDCWEVEGVTFAEFAPNIQVDHAARIGTGVLPEPLHPSWDQLINGSLDTEYVEIQGIVTAVDPDGVTLLTRSGKINVQLPESQPQSLPRYEHALVRIRGCVMPARNIKTQQVEPGQIGLTDTSIDVDEPAPADPFSAPLKHPSDLLLFDPRAGAFQRVRIDGQIVQQHGGVFFLMDQGDGLRFLPSGKIKAGVGDLVEVVGFPELGGPSPLLREAVVRRLGTAPLPPPQLLSQKTLISREYDGTRVRVEAKLTELSYEGSDQVLEVEAGTRGFEARLKASNGLLQGLSPGTLLELTGVYEGLGGNLASGREIDSFDLLLNSPADVTVLARPSWWTLRHTLTVVGVMALAIFAATIWITLLHRQVEERSVQLATEVHRREQTERQRELEKERARIARDLHDDLGATLTQIRFLSALESRDTQVPEGTRGRMSQISEKSREMVASLDEIVWAVNPTNDSLPSLANYLCHFAEEFFQPTPVRCRLDVDDSLPSTRLTSEVRHNLYLAVREALNNISKHSQASEVWLRIRFQNSELSIVIEDNGGGPSPAAGGRSGEGLTNMRLRLEEIGGRFEFRARPGAGTVCSLWLPLEPPLKIESAPGSSPGHQPVRWRLNTGQ